MVNAPLYPKESYEVCATCHMSHLALHLQPSCQRSVVLSHFVAISFETLGLSPCSQPSLVSPCSAITGSHVRVLSIHVCVCIMSILCEISPSPEQLHKDLGHEQRRA